MNGGKKVSDTISGKKKTGEFYTPDKLAKLMVELLFEGFDPVKNPEPKILDPSCGNGQLLIALFLKIFDIYSPCWANKENLKMHIVKNMIYGMDIDIQGLEKSKSRLFELSGNMSSNLFCYDFLTENGDKFKSLKGNFTHIIGNPPYIGHKSLEFEYKKKLKNIFPGIYENKTDILSCFFPAALNLITENGKIVFITSRYYLEAPTYRGLRTYLQMNCGIERIIDFDDLNVFKEARVASCITIFTKNKTKDHCFFYDRFAGKIEKTLLISLNEDGITLNGFGNFSRRLSNQESLDRKGWSFPSEEELEIRQIIEKKANYKLKDVFTSHQGIITGCDKAFVISGDMGKEEVKDWSESELKLLRPWIKNSWIEKYFVKGRNYKLIYTNGIKDISEFPNIEKRLSFYREKLENRRETKKNIRKWYELQWGRSEEIFVKRKIVHPYKASENRFAIDDNGNFCSADIYLMLPKPGFEYYLEYLTAVLNSNIYDIYFKSFGKRMGAKIFDYYPNKVMEMKVYIPADKAEVDAIVKLYEKMIYNYKSGISVKEEIKFKNEILIKKEIISKIDEEVIKILS